RVWSASRGALWITGWNSGDLFRYDSGPRVGGAGICQATGRSPTPFMWTTPMPCGSATGELTRFCASIPRPRNSSPFRYPIATPTCGGTVKLAESKLGRSRVARVNGRDDDDGSRPDLCRLSLPRGDHQLRGMAVFSVPV